jgi:hypothetical protein
VSGPEIPPNIQHLPHARIAPFTTRETVMSVRNLMTAIVFVFGLGAMGYGAFGVLAEGREGTAQGPIAVQHSTVPGIREAGSERIESPRECRHEIGIRDACTHM